MCVKYICNLSVCTAHEEDLQHPHCNTTSPIHIIHNLLEFSTHISRCTSTFNICRDTCIPFTGFSLMEKNIAIFLISDTTRRQDTISKTRVH